MNQHKSAMHEAAHRVAARAFGWHVHRARLFANGDGEASVVSLKGLDWRKRNREFVIIAYAAREYVGWTAAHGDRGDLRKAELALTELAQDRWERQRLRTDLRRQARELVAKPAFHRRARRVAKALAASGELNAYELKELLRRDEFRFEPAPNLRDTPIRA